MSQAEHLKTAHDTVGELLVFKQLADIVRRCYDVRLGWYSGYSSLCILMLVELFNIMRSHLGSDVGSGLVVIQTGLRKTTIGRYQRLIERRESFCDMGYQRRQRVRSYKVGCLQRSDDWGDPSQLRLSDGWIHASTRATAAHIRLSGSLASVSQDDFKHC